MKKLKKQKLKVDSDSSNIQHSEISMGENSSENIIFEIGKTDIVQSRQQKKADRKREKTKRLL